LTTNSGCPISHNKNSLTAGPTGPVVLTDYPLLEKIKHFTREKIPPRNVHGPGYGALGVFTATNPNIAKYSMAKVFQAGKKTKFVARFSGVFVEQGEPDTYRDLRGLALKFKTEEGNWDLLMVNTPIFNCRDMKIGPDAVHALKKDPRTGMSNPNTFWDFIGHHPEAVHHTLMYFTDRVGTPASFRHQNWFGANTYSFINDKKERFFVRFHVTTDLPWIGLTEVQAKAVAGEDPGYLGRDLKAAIERGEFPKWKVQVQIMTEDQGYAMPNIAFDCTKAWKHDDFPLVELGVIECNENPIDYFTQVEEVAFSPARVVPGIGFSPDKLLQGRLLVYDDAQNHRIGANYKQLPINCPLHINSNYDSGGEMNLRTADRFPNYQGSVFNQNEPLPNPAYMEPPLRSDGPVDFYDAPGEGTDLDYYVQAREFLQVMEPKEYQNMCKNIATALVKADIRVITLMMKHFNAINPKLGSTLTSLMEDLSKGNVSATAALYAQLLKDPASCQTN